MLKSRPRAHRPWPVLLLTVYTKITYRHCYFLLTNIAFYFSLHEHIIVPWNLAFLRLISDHRNFRVRSARAIVCSFRLSGYFPWYAAISRTPCVPVTWFNSVTLHGSPTVLFAFILSFPGKNWVYETSLWWSPSLWNDISARCLFKFWNFRQDALSPDLTLNAI